MPDQLDRAKELEMLRRENSLAAHKQTSSEPAQWIEGGRVLCLNCSVPVLPQRLRAKPNAAYCMECQQLRERGRI